MKNMYKSKIAVVALFAIMAVAIGSGCSSQNSAPTTPAGNLKALAAGTPPPEIAAQIAAEEAAAKQPHTAPGAPAQAGAKTGQ